MGKQHNRRIFAGFYKRYDNRYIYVVAVVPDVDTSSQVVIFHEGIDACECKYYSMTKQSFCEMVEVDGEWVDKFTRQPQIRITDTHIQNLNDGGFEGPVRKKKPKDEDLLVYESRRYRRAETYTDYAKDLCTNYKIDLRRYNLCVAQKRYNYFYNELKRGDLKITKTAEDGLVEGMKFHLYGTSLSGAKVDEYAYTDENGIAMFYDVLIGEGYTLEEVNTNIRYVVPAKQTANIAWNEVTNKSFENILKKFRVDVFKVDGYLYWGDPDEEGGLVPVSAVPMSLAVDSDQMVNEYGCPYGVTQGDASLEGAVYGLYNNGVLVDTYTTDKNGYFLTDYYVCGDNWYLQEITPSEGYLLDDTRYYIDCSAYEYTVELNTEYVDVYEAIIRGKIAIIKHCDDGSTKIETPEEGAAFAVYLKSAGSYDKAEEKERAILFCDEFGFAETVWLPYGTYVVEQIDGWEGKELMPAFDVNISADGETYRYLINNATFEAEIEIVKKDIETGNIKKSRKVVEKQHFRDT